MTDRGFVSRRGKKLKVLVILFSFLLISGVFVAAQNLSESELGDEVVNLCEDVVCEAVSEICSDGFVASCATSCDSETGVCDTCVPDCSGHDVVEEPNETSEEPLNETTPEQNETTSPENETEPTPEQNETDPSEEIITSPPEEPDSLPIELDIQLISPDSVTRNEEIDIQATITNTGNQAVTNVLARLQLPSGFDVISGNELETCGTLAQSETCELAVTVTSAVTTTLGTNEIKVLVGYDG